MNNPLEKKDNNLVLPIILGAAAAAAITYLLISEDGTEIREKISATVKDGWKSVQEQLPFSAEDLDGLKSTLTEKFANVLSDVKQGMPENNG